jgi:hypothetical protein
MEDRQDISIDEMKNKIEDLGGKAIWVAIEKIGNWQMRVAYRQVFFLAGGSLD